MNALTLFHEDVFAGLTSAQRRQLDKIEDHLATLLKAAEHRKLQGACKVVAPHIPGVSWKSLYRRVADYVKTGDPKKLIDRRESSSLWDTTAKTQEKAVPLATRLWWRGIMEKHQRCCASGIREIIQIWQTHQDARGKHWHAIPGYAEWPAADPATDRPAGWTDRNIYRSAPDKYQQKLARVSAAAAAQFRPPVLTRRFGLKHGQRVEFDDHDYNAKLLFPGQRGHKAMRPSGYTGVDVLCGVLRPCFKPTLWDVDELKKKVLREREFRWFVFDWLCTIGYRNDEAGTLFVGENAKAVFRDDFSARIFKSTHGRVRTCAGAMFTKSGHDGLWRPRGKGNFHTKPLIESSFNVVDNYLDRIPGQMGKDPDHSPAELQGRERYAVALLEDLEKAAPEIAARAQLPLLTWSQFLSAGYAIHDAINAATDHAMQDWDACGFTQIEWRLNAGMPWLPMERLLAMPESERKVANALIEQDPRAYQQCRRLSRQEAWDRGRNELTKLSPLMYCECMGLEDGVEVEVGKKGLISVTDPEFIGVGSEPLHFLATTRDGRRFRQGEKFLAYANWMNPHAMQLCTAKGEHVAVVDYWPTPCKADTDAVAIQMGRQSAWETSERAQMQAGHLDETLAREDLLRHNEALKPVTPTTQESKVTREEVEESSSDKLAALDLLSPED